MKTIAQLMMFLALEQEGGVKIINTRYDR